MRALAAALKAVHIIPALRVARVPAGAAGSVGVAAIPASWVALGLPLGEEEPCRRGKPKMVQGPVDHPRSKEVGHQAADQRANYEKGDGEGQLHARCQKHISQPQPLQAIFVVAGVTAVVRPVIARGGTPAV